MFSAPLKAEKSDELLDMHLVDAKGILSAKNGMNIYRGCTHGCIYCDSRSLCYHIDHPFEDIEVKQNAPELLEKALRSKRKKCVIGTGSMCDPYMPVEKELMIMRRCLEVIDHYGFGAALITKSDLVLRDLDLLCSINEEQKAAVQITMTTFSDELCRKIEPVVCPTSRRYEVLKKMQENHIPTYVWLTPILPYINDMPENISGLLDMCADAGVKGIVCFNMGLTLREGNREYFYSALDRLFPGLRKRYEKEYGLSYVVNSPDNGRLMMQFHSFCEKHGIIHDPEQCFEDIVQLPEKYKQLSLF